MARPCVAAYTAVNNELLLVCLQLSDSNIDCKLYKGVINLISIRNAHVEYYMRVTINARYPLLSTDLFTQLPFELLLEASDHAAIVALKLFVRISSLLEFHQSADRYSFIQPSEPMQIR